MLCELIASLLICTAEPETLRSEIINYRVSTAHTAAIKPAYIKSLSKVKKKVRKKSKRRGKVKRKN